MRSSRVKSISYLKANAEETLALLKLLAMGQEDVVEGRLTPLDEAMARVRADLTKV